MKPKIIFEDDYLLILDKPTGWIVNEAKTTGKNPVVQTWLKKNLDYQISSSKEYRSGIVHRLDKETSGVLIVARNKNTFRSLQKQFKKREVGKTYIALVHGKLEPSEGTVEMTVGRLPWNRVRFGVVPGGRKAITGYKALDNYSHLKDNRPLFTLTEFYPKSGRTHQIRVHAKYLGHPIVSDEFYAGRKTARRDRKWCPRLFLHAEKINFTHPKSHKNISFESRLPKELAKALGSLEKQPQTS